MKPFRIKLVLGFSLVLLFVGVGACFLIKKSPPFVKTFLFCTKSWITGKYPFHCSIGENSLKKTITETNRYALLKDRLKFFKKSGWDQFRSFNEAKQILTSTYQLPLEREALQSRVLAVRFLAWSSHWKSLKECTEILDFLKSQYSEDLGELLRFNLLIDVGDLAKVCSQMDAKGLAEYHSQLNPEAFKDQIKLGGGLDGHR